MQTRQSIHSLAAEKICEAETQTDEHLRCIKDAMLCGTRVVKREPSPEPRPLTKNQHRLCAAISRAQMLTRLADWSRRVRAAAFDREGTLSDEALVFGPAVAAREAWQAVRQAHEVVDIEREIHDRLRVVPRQHTCDADCAPYLLADGECSVCGVWHNNECPECHGFGFHAPACPDNDCTVQPTETPLHRALVLALARSTTWKGEAR
jgi:hypothetical protein